MNMQNNKVCEMLNEQFGKEIFSSYLYLAIGSYFVAKNLDGFANWFDVQAKEELDHALIFRKYLLDEGFSVNHCEIARPMVEYAELKDALAAVLAHEQMITASIGEIYSEALSAKDYKTTQFLDWFVKEQGEEEKNSKDLIAKFELFAGDGKGLYMLNAELKTRIYAPPSLVL